MDYWQSLQSGLFLLILPVVWGFHDLAKGCGVNGKHCISRPHDCLPNPKMCDQMAAVSVLSSSQVHIEIRAKGAGIRNRWVGLGFSEDENMGRDAVIHCIQNATATEMKLTYNPDHTNLQDGILQTPLHVTEAALEDDGLHCAGDLDKRFFVMDHEYDLTTSHHFLFSTGPLKAGRILKHDKVPIISTEAYSF